MVLYPIYGISSLPKSHGVGLQLETRGLTPLFVTNALVIDFATHSKFQS